MNSIVSWAYCGGMAVCESPYYPGKLGKIGETLCQSKQDGGLAFKNLFYF